MKIYEKVVTPALLDVDPTMDCGGYAWEYVRTSFFLFGKKVYSSYDETGRVFREGRDLTEDEHGKLHVHPNSVVYYRPLDLVPVEYRLVTP